MATMGDGTAEPCTAWELDGKAGNRKAMEMSGKAMPCGLCLNSRKNSADGVYCRLFGIMIHRDHQGCKYHTGGKPDEQVRGQENDGIRADV